MKTKISAVLRCVALVLALVNQVAVVFSGASFEDNAVYVIISVVATVISSAEEAKKLISDGEKKDEDTDDK